MPGLTDQVKGQSFLDLYDSDNQTIGHHNVRRRAAKLHFLVDLPVVLLEVLNDFPRDFDLRLVWLCPKHSRGYTGYRYPARLRAQTVKLAMLMIQIPAISPPPGVSPSMPTPRKRAQRPPKEIPLAQDPQTELILEEIQSVKKSLATLEIALNMRWAALVNKSLGTTHGDGDLHFGDWRCEASPTMKCVYFEGEDWGAAYLHLCLFCGDPEERA